MKPNISKLTTIVLLLVGLSLAAPFSFSLADAPSTEAYDTHTSRAVQEADPRGGSWLDTFDEASGIDASQSSGIETENGAARILLSDGDAFRVDEHTAGLWNFSEGFGTSVTDASPNNNNGAFVGSPQWTTGISGSALYFKGGSHDTYSDGVRIPNSTSLQVENNFTMEALIKAKGNQDYNCIIDKFQYNSFTDQNGYTLYLSELGYIRFHSHNGTNNKSLATPPDFRDNKWHHMAATFDGQYYSLYVDGVKVNGGIFNYAPAPTQGDLGIGMRLSGWGGYLPFQGIIDDVRISSKPRTPVQLKSQVVSKTISLPSSMNWQSMIFNKTMKMDNGYINVTILNAADNKVIPGTPVYLQDGEYDISYIDPVKYPEIKLKATIEANSWVARYTTLNYWGVSWNATDVWRDTFFGGIRIEDYNDKVEVNDGHSTFNKGGMLTTKPLEIPSDDKFIYYFDYLNVNADIPEGSDFQITVFDADQNIIPGFQALKSQKIDLKTIDTKQYPKIQFRVLFYSIDDAKGTLYDWAVELLRNTAPSIVDVSVSSSVVNRTNMETISINIYDKEELEQDLSILVEYKSPSNTSWQTTNLQDPYYALDHWEINFTPPKDAELGYYSFRFNCTDNLVDFDVLIETQFLEVVNNKPVLSEITTSPTEFYVYRTQSINIFYNASDIEIPASELDMRIYYKPLGSDIWRNNYFTDISFQEYNWKVEFSPPSDAEVGMYSFRINVNDSDDELINTFWIDVRNNPPTKPEVEIIPKNPNATDELTVVATNSTDTETSSEDITYWYRWYKNDTYQEGYDNSTVISNTSISASDTWKFIVFAFDGDGVSEPVEVTITIYNPARGDIDNDGTVDLVDAFPEDPAASKDTDGDGYPDDWNSGMSQDDSTTNLTLDAFPTDPAASKDTDGDGFPDEWNPGKTESDSTTGLHLDAFPTDPAASLDTDDDGYPNEWNPGKSKDDSTTGLKIDEYPNDPDKWKKPVEEEFEFTLIIVAVTFLVLIFLLLIIMVYRTKRQRKYSGSLTLDKGELGDMKKSDRVYLEVRNKIIQGKITRSEDLKKPGMEKLLEEKHSNGEISDMAYDYIKNFIEENEELSYGKQAKVEKQGDLK